MSDSVDARLRDYNTLASSFVLGLFRLSEARIVALTTAIALFRLHSEPPEADGIPRDNAIVDELRRISYSEYDSFRYVTDASLLVYATTLLDTFLTDTTRFLLLLHPDSIGDNQTVSLKSLLSAASTAELITDAALRRAREISYLPFLGRIEFLRKKFGLEIVLNANTVADLDHYSGIRNVVVHDQAVFDVRLDHSGVLEVSRKTCPRHPTLVKSTDLAAALRAYRVVAVAIYRDVVTRVLKSHPDENFLRAVAAFDRGEAKAPLEEPPRSDA